jgi:hypothetical protein
MRKVELNPPRFNPTRSLRSRAAKLKQNSPPEMTVHLIAKSRLLLKSAITEQELFVTLTRPRLTLLIDPHVAENLPAASLGKLPRLGLDALAFPAGRYPRIAVFHR